ncbi:alpha/beta hydrolase family protein [Streptomyces sp. SCSIO ZS0520]|uniref:alpha/beta hydrolase family protein n=1 Tax=Streptomyces sp. SCSIO ZS0520 TaxID=2892996 RepID=UPI0021DB6CC0|nr:alpha/beta hydrolase [Streptomyces sp. SCSIO ZS0520]
MTTYRSAARARTGARGRRLPGGRTAPALGTRLLLALALAAIPLAAAPSALAAAERAPAAAGQSPRAAGQSPAVAERSPAAVKRFPAAAQGEAHAGAQERLRLPRPTGPFRVGAETLHLTDHSRRDPWVPEAGDRELMVSLSYPARSGGAGRERPYLTGEEARLLVEFQGRPGVDPARVAATRTHARTGARPAPGRFPLVLLSPGFTLPRATLTSLAEDLASRGYVVAAIDHAYESSGTAFPGGRTLTCVACERTDPETGDTPLAAVAEGRAADFSFVLDQLTGPRGAAGARTGGGDPALRPYTRLIDRERTAAAGHSIGGNASSAVMAADERVGAGVNMDGTFFAPVPAAGLGGRPFLMLGADAHHGPGGGDASWDTGWAALDGYKRWLTVTGTGHMSFTDLPVLGDQLGLEDPGAPLPGARSAEVTRDYLAAFLTLHLKSVPQPLLDGPTPQNPEVRFHRPRRS